jgi:periplasmic protein TonB
MKKHLLIFLILFVASVFVHAQTSAADTNFFPPPPLSKKEKTIKENYDKEFSVVEVEAEFPGGLREWSKFLQKNLNANVPVDNRALKGKYMVIVRFIVDKEGKISDIIAQTNYGYGMEKEVMRVIALGPNWIPAMQNGKIVKSYKRQPVTFLID